jgi:hypothetical protein
VHNWDGLTDYEVVRAGMLVEMGYSVFAADLFGAGIRPTKLKDKRQHTGEPYSDQAKMRTLMEGALQAAAEQGAFQPFEASLKSAPSSIETSISAWASTILSSQGSTPNRSLHSGANEKIADALLIIM